VYEVRLGDRAYIKTCRMLYEIDKEFAFMLIGRRRNHIFTIKDIFIPEQKVSDTHCKILDNGYAEISKVLNSVVGWGHSHSDFGAFHSGTDMDTGALCGLFYPPFASLTVSRVSAWDCRVFTGDVGDIGKNAKLKLPADIPKNKIKVEKVPVYKAPVYTPHPYGQPQRSLINRVRGIFTRRRTAPDREYCSACPHYSVYANKCRYINYPDGVPISSLKECPVEVECDR